MNTSTRPARPFYFQIKEHLLNDIAAGRYKPGDQLPSQRDLIKEFDASLMTIRRVINELSQEGVIYALPGKGLFVSQPKQDAEAIPLHSFTAEMRRRGMQPSSHLLAAQIVSAPTTLARIFNIEVGLPLVYLKRLRLADGQPMALQTAYLPHAICPGLLEHDLERQSLYQVLCDSYGLCLSSAQFSIEAVLADEEHAALLGASLPSALLVTEQLTFLEAGQAIEFVRSVYRGDRYRMRM
jgi:GntR family transcriptional regulator